MTGTEVLTGRVTDRNGPWLAERLRELGVDLAHIAIVGDRPEDMRAALEFMAREELDLAITSGGLGPTADDLTAAVVGGFQGREMVLDEALSGRIAAIVAPLMKRWPNIDPEAVERANRKQATVPVGAEVLEPVGTAPGLVVPPGEGTAHPDGGGAAGAAAGAAADVDGGGRDRGDARGARAGDGVSPGDAAAVRRAGVRAGGDATRSRTRGRRARRARGDDVPETRRARGRDPLRAGARPGLRRVPRGDAPPLRRDDVLRGRAHDRPAPRRDAASARADDRHGGVVHGRPAWRHG